MSLQLQPDEEGLVLKFMHRHSAPADATPSSGVAIPRQRRAAPHVAPLVIGLFDARLSHVDYFDTVAGQELARYYRQLRHPGTSP